jgi:hypothetical protein
VCTIDAGIPSNTTPITATSVVYTWAVGSYTSTSGTNLRRVVLKFGTPGTVTVTVTAKLASTTLATASTVLTVK